LGVTDKHRGTLVTAGLIVTGVASLADFDTRSASVLGNVVISGTGSVTQNWNVRSLTTTNNIAVTGAGSVAGTLSIDDSLNVNSLGTFQDLVVSGASSLAGALAIDDALTVNSLGTFQDLVVSNAASIAGTVNVDDALTVSSRVTLQNVTGSDAFRGFTTIASGDAFVTVSATAANSGIPVFACGQSNVASLQQIVFSTNSVVDGVSFAIVPHEAPSQGYDVSWFIME
jgi:hypothetical protein